jgi:hypothetical protein
MERDRAFRDEGLTRDVASLRDVAELVAASRTESETMLEPNRAIHSAR